MHVHDRPARRRRNAVVVAFAAPLTGLVAVAAATGAGATTAAPVGSAASPAAQVSVNPAQALAKVPGTAIGINASTYDGSLLDTQLPALLRNVGTKVIRIPGGSQSDEYNWKTNTDVIHNFTEAVNFGQFMSVIQKAGAQAMVTVDYGTGNTIGQQDGSGETGAQVAADWVRFANVQHHYNIKYWEIGNEVYGNGTYGANWESDAHCTTAAGTPVTLGSEPGQTFSCGPAAYAANTAQYISAMKAVDPHISIGPVLTTPGNWPDGVTNAQNPVSWDQAVMSALGSRIGFADVHWYAQNPSNVTPPGPTDAGLLADSSQIPGMVATLRSELTAWAGKADIPIMVTETNSVSSNPGKQILSTVNALFLEQNYLTWLENGVSSVDWWQAHNGIVTSGDNGPALFGSANYGDYGVLSDGTSGTTPGGVKVSEPPAETPFASYYGLVMLSRFIHPGDTLVSASSSQGLVKTFAVRSEHGALRVMVVNDDPANSYSLQVSVPDYRISHEAPVQFYGTTSSQVQVLHGSAARAAVSAVPPYSVTTFTLSRA
jgi:hypothetical protein